jgi:hypothetical protein
MDDDGGAVISEKKIVKLSQDEMPPDDIQELGQLKPS